MKFSSKALSDLWEQHPIILFLPSVISLIASVILVFSGSSLLKMSVGIFLLFTGLYLTLYVNTSIHRGYMAIEGAYKWEAPLNFWGICLVYGILSISLILVSLLMIFGVV